MVRAAALSLLLLLTAPAIAQFEDSPWLDWVVRNAPHGFDITPDGTIWINLAEPGQRDDYAIRAEDLQAARMSNKREHSFWVRGYHKRNPAVAYRETKARFTVDCDREMLSRSLIAYYDSGGDTMGQLGYLSPSHIIPGTYGAEYHRLFCLVSD